MKQKVIIVEEDHSVYEAEIEESGIPSLLGGGFVTAILRLVEEGIEYAHVDYRNNYKYEVTWDIPHKKVE